LNANAPEAIANRGLMSLIDGNVGDAEADIAKAAGSENVSYAIGVLNLAKGNYAQAEKELGGQNTNAAALAQLLNKNYAASVSTLDKAVNQDALTSYLHAIVAARQGNKFAASSYLKEAIEKDPSLQSYADNDLELSILK